MTDPRRIASIACFMLVTLRLMIGWQLLYEGFWKIKTLKSPTPWTASGYLKNSQGPLRGQFRAMTGDPDDLSWIDAVPIKPDAKPSAMQYKVPGVEQKWLAWQKKFTSHYKLDKRDAARLNGWVNGAKTFQVELDELPKSVDFKKLKIDSVMSYDGKRKRLIVNGTTHMLPSVRDRMEKALDADVDGIPDLVDIDAQPKNEDGGIIAAEGEIAAADTDDDGIIDAADVDSTEGKDANKNGIDDSNVADKEAVYLVAVKAAFKKSKDGMGYIEKLRATVAGNPDWIEDKGQQRLGEIKKYKVMLAAYEEDLAEAKKAGSTYPFQDKSFRFDHLQHNWGKIQKKRSELIGPVKALDKELKDKAESLLSVEQMKRGPVGKPWTTLYVSDMLTIAGLTVLGAMLILGLGTRFAAVMAAVMLFMFYAAMPPWPGVPAAPGPEHSFIVNKNFIEVIALLAIAVLPTGRWFGVDGMISRIFASRRAAKEGKFSSKWEGNG